MAILVGEEKVFSDCKRALERLEEQAVGGGTLEEAPAGRRWGGGGALAGPRVVVGLLETGDDTGGAVHAARVLGKMRPGKTTPGNDVARSF